MLKRFLIAAALILGCGCFSYGQGVRIGDNYPITSSLTTPGFVSTVSNALINVCTFPANAVPCTNKATTYTSVTLGTPCSTSTQVVLFGTNSCVSTTDGRGNWGAWVAAGNYDFTVTVSTGQSFGPFTLTAGIPSGTNLSLGVLTVTGALNANTLNGHFWAGPGTTPTIDTQITAAVAAGGGIVDIHPSYTGAESSGCTTNGSDGFNTWSGNNLVNVIDWRSSGTCQYTIAVNGSNAAGYGLTPFATTKIFSSPLTTASAAIFTAKYTGALAAGGGNLNGATSEMDVIGAVTSNPTATMVGHLFESHVRSTGGTIPDFAAITTMASIDRTGASTNITRNYGVYVNPCSNISSSGSVIANCYGVYILRNTAGGTSNYGLFLTGGRARFGYASGDNGFDLETTGGAPQNILQNDGTDTLSYRPLSDAKGFAWKNTSNVTLASLDVGTNLFNLNFGQSFAETTPPSAATGQDTCYGDSTQHTILCSMNNGPFTPLTGTFTKVNVTPVTVSANVSTDQNGMAVTVTAGALNSVSRTLLIQLAGVYSTPAASTTTLTHKLKLCTVSGCGSGTVITLASWTSSALGGVQATNNPYNIITNSSTQTAGASAAFEAHGNLTIDVSALASAAEAVFADNNTTTVGTIDSTAQLFLQHTIAFSAASASNSATDRHMIADTVD